MKNSGFYVILWIAMAALAVFLIFRYLWPVILVLAVLAIAGYFRTRRMVSRTEHEAQAYAQQEEDHKQNLEDQLFEEQVRKKKEEESVIIDAEFKPVDKQEGIKENERHG